MLGFRFDGEGEEETAVCISRKKEREKGRETRRGGSLLESGALPPFCGDGDGGIAKSFETFSCYGWCISFFQMIGFRTCIGDIMDSGHMKDTVENTRKDAAGL